MEGGKIKTGREDGEVSSEEWNVCPVGMPRVERLQHFTVDLSCRSLPRMGVGPVLIPHRANSSFRVSRILRGRRVLEFLSRFNPRSV